MFPVIPVVTIFMATSFQISSRFFSREILPNLVVALVGVLMTSVWILPDQVVGQENSSSAELSRHDGSIIVPECRVKFANDVQLAFERSGVLDYLTPQGAQVRLGEPIARLNDLTAKAAYRISEKEASNDIEIRFARKASELAQLKYERATQADKTLSGTVTEFELRELRLAAERSLLQMQQAEHQFAIADLKKREQLELLNSLQITAPFDGFVRVAEKQAGEYVREGEIVIEVVNDQVIRISGTVDLADVHRVQVGSRVTVYSHQLGSANAFYGTVNFVDTKVEPVSNKVKISALVQNSNSILKDGLLVTMAIAPTNAHQISSR